MSSEDHLIMTVLVFQTAAFYFLFLFNMKNFKISKTKVQLSEEQVEKLYKEYGKIDSKQQKFKGTKREYVDKVGGMIGEWLNATKPKVLPDKKSLIGGTKKDDLKAHLDLIKDNRKEIEKIETARAKKREPLTDNDHKKIAEFEAKIRELRLATPAFEREVEAEEANIQHMKELYEAVPSDDSEAKKRAYKEYLRSKVSKYFPSDVFDKTKKKIQGTLPFTREKEYRERPQMVENPFLSTKPGFKTYAGDTPRAKFESMLEELYNFKEIFECFTDDETAQRNMLVLLPFKHIFNITPLGVRQRQLVVQHLQDIGRAVVHKTSEKEWSSSAEGAYRSEKFIFDHYLVGGLDPSKVAFENYKLLGKIMSLKQFQDRVDYVYTFFTGDSKGKKSVGGIGEGEAPYPQVSFDKIVAVIFRSLGDTSTPSTESMINPNILFNIYKSNVDLIKYNEEAPDTDEYGDNKVPFEICFKLNLKKVLDFPLNQTEGHTAEIFSWYEEIQGKSDQEQQKFFSKKKFNVRCLPTIRTAVKNYLVGNEDTEFTMGVGLYTTTQGTCLDIPISTLTAPSGSTPAAVGKIRVANELKNGLDVVGFSNSLFPKAIEEIRVPTAQEYGDLFSTEEGLEIYRDFHGDTYFNYTFVDIGDERRLNMLTQPTVTIPEDVGEAVADVVATAADTTPEITEEEKEAIDDEISRLIFKDSGAVDALNRPFFRGTYETKKEKIEKLKEDKPYLFLPEAASGVVVTSATPITTSTSTSIRGPHQLPPQPPLRHADVKEFAHTTFQAMSKVTLLQLAYVTGTYDTLRTVSPYTKPQILEAIKKKLGALTDENPYGVRPDGSIKFFQIRTLAGEPLAPPIEPTDVAEPDISAAVGSDTTTSKGDTESDSDTTPSGRGKPRKVGKGDDEDLAVMLAQDKVEELNLLFDVLMDKGVLTDEAAKIAEELSEAEEELEAAIKYKKYKDEKDQKINDLERTITYEEYKEDQLTRSYQRFLNERERRVASKVLTEKMDIAMRERENQFVKDIHEVQRRLKESRLELAKIQPRRPVKTKKPKKPMTPLKEEDESKSGDGGLTPKTPEGGKYIKKVVKYYR